MTADALSYLPRANSAGDLAIERQAQPDGDGLARCWVQKSPARQLPNLQHVPILILTAEASYHAPYDHCTVKFLEQAGVKPTWTKLAEAGIHGNGHMMMIEKNNADIAALISRWLAKARFCPRSGRRVTSIQNTSSGRPIHHRLMPRIIDIVLGKPDCRAME